MQIYLKFMFLYVSDQFDEIFICCTMKTITNTTNSQFKISHLPFMKASEYLNN